MARKSKVILQFYTIVIVITCTCLCSNLNADIVYLS